MSWDETTKSNWKQTDKQTINFIDTVRYYIVVIGAPINKAKLAKYRRQEFQIKDTTLSANVSNHRPISIYQTN